MDFMNDSLIVREAKERYIQTTQKVIAEVFNGLDSTFTKEMDSLKVSLLERMRATLLDSLGPMHKSFEAMAEALREAGQ